MMITVLDNTLLAVYFLDLLCMVVLAFLCLRGALTERGWLYPMFTAVFGCLFLADGFIILTWLLMEYPYVFSAADLSFLGAMLMLVTINNGLFGEVREESSVPKRRYVPWLGAVAVMLCHVLYITIYPEIWLNYLIYGVILALVAYSACRLLVAAPDQPTARYSVAVLLTLVCFLLMDLFSSLGFYYGFAIPDILSNLAATVALVYLFITARRMVVA